MLDENKCYDCGVDLDIMNKALCVKCNKPLCEDCSLMNNFMCSECSKPAPTYKPEYVRRSHIEDYQDCPYYYYLENVKGIEAEHSIEATVGIELHDLYYKWQQGLIKKNEELLEEAEKTVLTRKKELDETTYNKMLTRAIGATTGFLKVIQGLNNKIIALEKTIFFSVGEGLPKVRITMDRVDEDINGYLHLHDWKTGRVMTGKHLATNLQVPLYIKAVEEEYQKKVKSFTLYYLAEGKIRVYTHLVGDIYICIVRKREYKNSVSNAIKETQKVFRNILSGRFSIPDKPKFIKCKMCTYKKQGYCQGNINEFYNQIRKENEKILDKGWNTIYD